MRFIDSPSIPLLKIVSSYKILVYFLASFNLPALISLFFLLSTGQAQQKSVRYTPEVKAVYNAMPSTVVITEADVRFDRGLVKPKVLGSGVIIDVGGYILTNEHVIRGYDDLEIVMFKGEKYPGEVLFRSQEMDLALVKLKVKPKQKLKAIKMAFPNDLLLGETVLTIGNPFGLTFSISDGILSSTGRKLNSDNGANYDNLLQTSIKVNPGNSGGPLINLKGEMVGIMVASQNEAQGIGFAIPITKIEKAVSSWFSPERQSYSELGFSVITKFDAKKNKAFAVVKGVQQGKLNNLLGVKNGQKIVKVDETPITTALDFYRYVKNKKTGQQITLRTDTKKEFFVQLFPLKGLTLAKAKLGLEMQRLGPDIARAISIPFNKGFVLSGVNVGANFKVFKVRPGDMLFKIGDRIVMNDADLQELLKDVESGDRLDVVFMRVIPDGDSSHIETLEDVVTVR